MEKRGERSGEEEKCTEKRMSNRERKRAQTHPSLWARLHSSCSLYRVKKSIAGLREGCSPSSSEPQASLSQKKEKKKDHHRRRKVTLEKRLPQVAPLPHPKGTASLSQVTTTTLIRKKTERERDRHTGKDQRGGELETLHRDSAKLHQVFHLQEQAQMHPQLLGKCIQHVFSLPTTSSQK